MVKSPRAGRVKTRLGAQMGMSAAAWWYRHQVRALLRRVQSPKWDIVLAVSPDRDEMHHRYWPSGLPKVGQGRGDLGDRMARILGSESSRPILIIGSDIPGITQGEVAAMFELLRIRDCAMGPSEDGGYWGIGLRAARKIPNGAFRNVRWSTQFALEDTCASLRPLEIAFSTTLRDIDTLDDLRAK